MSVITQLLTLLNWKVRQQSDSRKLGRRTHSYGVDILLRVNTEESHVTRTLGWDFQVRRCVSLHIYWLCQPAVSPIVALFQRRFRRSVVSSIAIDGSGRGSSVLVLREAISHTYRVVSTDTEGRIASKLSVLKGMTALTRRERLVRTPEIEDFWERFILTLKGSGILAYNLCNESSASVESEREHPAFDLEFIDRDDSQETSGIELIAERANDQSALTDPRQEINVYPTVFADGIVFSNGDEGGWISADGDSYIDLEEL